MATMRCIKKDVHTTLHLKIVLVWVILTLVLLLLLKHAGIIVKWMVVITALTLAIILNC